MKLNIVKFKCVFTLLILLLGFAVNKPALFAAEVTLSWDPPAVSADGTPLQDLAGYFVYIGSEPLKYSQRIDVGNVTTYHIDSLTPGSTYYFAVSAYDISGNESDYSFEVSKYIVNNDTSPPLISGVYADNVTRSSADIHWTTDESADSQVEYGTTLSFGHTSPADSTLTTVHSQTISVAPSTQYYFRVISHDASGNESVSSHYTFTSAEQADVTPPVLFNVQVTDITPSSAVVSWTTDEASSSQVEYGLTQSYGMQTRYDSSLVTAHSALLSGLDSFSTYHFRVRSMDAGYNESLSEDYFFVTSNLPPVIASLSASPASSFPNQAITFQGSTSDPDGYIVRHEWDFDADGVYDMNTGTDPGAVYSYGSPGTYRAALRVTDNGGASVTTETEIRISDPGGSSPPLSVSLSAEPASGPAPLQVTLSAVSADQEGPIVSYEWDFDGNGTYEASTTTSPVSNTYENQGTYEVKVRVTDSYGNSAVSGATIMVYKYSHRGKGSSSYNGGPKKSSRRR